MKAQSITTLFLVALLVAACGPQEEGLDAKKSQLTEARAELLELNARITQLTKEIEAEDPDYFKSKNEGVRVTSLAANVDTFEHKIEIRGSVMSRTNVQVGSELGGKLTAVRVKEGQKVRKGQVLAVTGSEDIERNIDAINTQLEFATTVFEKRDRLWKKNIGTEIQYLEAKNNKESLEKQLAQLETQLSKTIIRAPFAGTIESVPVKVGQVLQPTQPVALLVGNSDMYIAGEVSESFIGKFKVGDPVSVYIPSMEEDFVTEISSIGQVINQASRTFTVEVKLPKGEYKTNLVTVMKLTDYKNDAAVIIPSRIIQEDLKGNFVYLIDNNKAKKVHITLGMSYDNHTQVVAGLNGGETIVDKGNRAVADGTTITLQN